MNNQSLLPLLKEIIGNTVMFIVIFALLFLMSGDVIDWQELAIKSVIIGILYTFLLKAVRKFFKKKD